MFQIEKLHAVAMDMEWIRSHALALPLLVKFAVGLGIFIVVPQLCRRLRIPGVVGLLLAGALIGPYGLEVFGKTRPIYSRDERLTIWSLTLPQVAATLAATLVAFKTVDRGGAHLLDDRMLNVVLALMLCTAILGPVLTEHFAPRLVKEESPGGGQAQAIRPAA